MALRKKNMPPKSFYLRSSLKTSLIRKDVEVARRKSTKDLIKK